MKIELFFISLLITANLICQAQNKVDSVYYYYHGQQIQIPLNKTKFMLYFEDSVSAKRSGLVSEKDFSNPTMILCKRINSNYGCKNFIGDQYCIF